MYDLHHQVISLCNNLLDLDLLDDFHLHRNSDPLHAGSDHHSHTKFQ